MGVFSKNGAWWIEYYVNGRRKRERIGRPLSKDMKKVALDVLAKRRVELAEGKYLDKRKIPRYTFAELAALYVEWARVNHQGFAATRSRIQMLQVEFGTFQLHAITPLMVDAYVNQRAAIRKPATVNRETQILHHMFQKAMEWGKALQNPVKHQKPLRVNNRRLRYLSIDEIERLSMVADDILRPLLTAALHTGLRRGELFALTWKDIDFKLRIIRVLHTKNGDRREIPMTDTLRETLRRLPRRLDSEHIFPGKTGHGLVDIRKRFTRALQAAGIEGFVFHDLRHTFASQLVMAGVDLMTVKEFLGHKDIKMTLRYAHLAPDYKRSAITRLDTYMDTSHKKGVTEISVTP
jgi:integrase